MHTSCKIAQTSVTSMSNVHTNSGFQCHFSKTVGLLGLKKEKRSSMYSNRKTHSSHYCTVFITVFIVFLVCLFFWMTEWCCSSLSWWTMFFCLRDLVINVSQLLKLRKLFLLFYHKCHDWLLFSLDLIVLSNSPTQFKTVQLMMCFIGDWWILFLFSSFLNLLCK